MWKKAKSITTDVLRRHAEGGAGFVDGFFKGSQSLQVMTGPGDSVTGKVETPADVMDAVNGGFLSHLVSKGKPAIAATVMAMATIGCSTFSPPTEAEIKARRQFELQQKAQEEALKRGILRDQVRDSVHSSREGRQHILREERYDSALERKIAAQNQAAARRDIQEINDDWRGKGKPPEYWEEIEGVIVSYGVQEFYDMIEIRRRAYSGSSPGASSPLVDSTIDSILPPPPAQNNPQGNNASQGQSPPTERPTREWVEEQTKKPAAETSPKRRWDPGNLLGQ